MDRYSRSLKVPNNSPLVSLDTFSYDIDTSRGRLSKCSTRLESILDNSTYTELVNEDTVISFRKKPLENSYASFKQKTFGASAGEETRPGFNGVRFRTFTELYGNTYTCGKCGESEPAYDYNSTHGRSGASASPWTDLSGRSSRSGVFDSNRTKMRAPPLGASYSRSSAAEVGRKSSSAWETKSYLSGTDGLKTPKSARSNQNNSKSCFLSGQSVSKLAGSKISNVVGTPVSTKSPVSFSRSHSKSVSFCTPPRRSSVSKASYTATPATTIFKSRESGSKVSNTKPSVSKTSASSSSHSSSRKSTPANRTSNKSSGKQDLSVKKSTSSVAPKSSSSKASSSNIKSSSSMKSGSSSNNSQMNSTGSSNTTRRNKVTPSVFTNPVGSTAAANKDGQSQSKIKDAIVTVGASVVHAAKSPHIEFLLQHAGMSKFTKFLRGDISEMATNLLKPEDLAKMGIRDAEDLNRAVELSKTVIQTLRSHLPKQ